MALCLPFVTLVTFSRRTMSAFNGTPLPRRKRNKSPVRVFWCENIPFSPRIIARFFFFELTKWTTKRSHRKFLFNLVEIHVIASSKGKVKRYNPRYLTPKHIKYRFCTRKLVTDTSSPLSSVYCSGWNYIVVVADSSQVVYVYRGASSIIDNDHRESLTAMRNLRFFFSFFPIQDSLEKDKRGVCLLEI